MDVRTNFCLTILQHFAKKNIFCVIISRLQRFYKSDFRFMPESFLLPDEAQDLEIFMRKYPNQTFICKPSRGRGGEGIQLARKFSDLPRQAFSSEYTVQRYIDNPLLINNKKFDFRLYVVIKGVDRVEAYICEEGIARFCTVSQFYDNQFFTDELQKAWWTQYEKFIHALNQLQPQ